MQQRRKDTRNHPVPVGAHYQLPQIRAFLYQINEKGVEQNLVCLTAGTWALRVPTYEYVPAQTKIPQHTKKITCVFHTLSCIKYYFLSHGNFVCINRLISNLRNGFLLGLELKVYKSVNLSKTFFYLNDTRVGFLF